MADLQCQYESCIAPRKRVKAGKIFIFVEWRIRKRLAGEIVNQTVRKIAIAASLFVYIDFNIQDIQNCLKIAGF